MKKNIFTLFVLFMSLISCTGKSSQSSSLSSEVEAAILFKSMFPKQVKVPFSPKEKDVQEYKSFMKEYCEFNVKEESEKEGKREIKGTMTIKDGRYFEAFVSQILFGQKAEMASAMAKSALDKVEGAPLKKIAAFHLVFSRNAEGKPEFSKISVTKK